MKQILGATMKLVHVTTVPFSLKFFLRGQVRFMQQRGFEVSAVSSPGPLLDEFGRQEGIAVHGIEMSRRISPLADAAALTKMVQLFRRIRPQIVHAHTPKAGLLAMLAAWLTRVPVRVYHLHCLPLATATGCKRRLLCWSDRLACRLAQEVYCVSHSLRQLVADEGLCPLGKLMVLHHGSIGGVDAETEFNPSRFHLETRAAVRRRWQIPPDAPLVGFVGRIVREKGIEELASAWQRVREEVPDAHLLLIGPPEPHDPIDARWQAALEHDPRVHFAGYQDDIPPLLYAIDVLALPSHREGFGTAAIEAGAIERPVVATRIPGCVDSVQDGVTGTLVSPRDAIALAAALTRYLSDPVLRRQHGLAGRRRAIDNFSPRLIFTAQCREYARLLVVQGLSAPDAADESSHRRAA